MRLLSVQELAKGTFYIYFETKADVLIYMLKAYDDYYDKVAYIAIPVFMRFFAAER